MSEQSDGGQGTGEGGQPPERMDLPKWNRARTKRKAPKGEEQDAFTGGLRGAGRRAKRHWVLFVGAGAALVGSIYGVIWWQEQAAEQSAVGTRMLATAAAYEARGEIGELGEYAKRNRPPPVPIAADQEQLDATVVEALGNLEEAQPQSKAALAAHLVRAQRSMRAGDHAAAETEYRAFVDAATVDHPAWFAGQEGLALALEGKGDVEGALAALEVLAREPGAFFRDQALYHKARLLEAQERTEEAVAVYKQYAEEFPLGDPSLARDEVRKRLEQLAPESLTEPAPEPVVEVLDAPAQGGQ